MWVIRVSLPGGTPVSYKFSKASISFGRTKNNDILLPKENVSKQHAVLGFVGKDIAIEDLGSTNGTLVNDRKIVEPTPVQPEDKIQIGDYLIDVSYTVVKDLPLEQTQHSLAAYDQGKNNPPENSSRFSNDNVLTNIHQHQGTVVEFAPVLSPTLAHSDVSLGASSLQAVDVGRSLQAFEGALYKARQQGKIRQSNDRSKSFHLGGVSLLDASSDIDASVRWLHEKLAKQLNWQDPALKELDVEDQKSYVYAMIYRLIEELQHKKGLPSGIHKEDLCLYVFKESIGLAPIEELLDSNDISEILVNHSGQVYVENKGVLQQSHVTFSSEHSVFSLAQRIVGPLGRELSRQSPMVDGRLKDGSRVNIIMSPLSTRGTCITIRKFSKKPLTVEDLIRYGSMTPAMAEFLNVCVQTKRNVIISGGTGSGKTTLLNVMSSFISYKDRIVTIEDAAELQLNQEHVVSLETRPATIDGTPAVTIRDLVKNSLRMRPDRIVVGECRGGEALDMLQAMNTGHDGSMTTIHANTPRDALARIETLVLMSGFDLSSAVIRQQIASAVDIIVQQTRLADGSRRVTAISEIVGMEQSIISMQDLFSFQETGYSPEGKLQGYFKPMGYVPRFYEELRKLKMDLDLSIFKG